MPKRRESEEKEILSELKTDLTGVLFQPTIFTQNHGILRVFEVFEVLEVGLDVLEVGLDVLEFLKKREKAVVLNEVKLLN